VSKWKTIRKERLEDYASYEFTRGALSGAAVATAAAGVGGNPVLFGTGIGFVLALVAYSHLHRNSFSRIRKAIDDAGGEDL
jgi:hypothetical protein